MQCYRSMLFRLSADDNGAVRVVDHVVADAAQDGAPERAHAAGAGHDQLRTLLLRHLHDVLPGTPEPRHHPTSHLQKDKQRNIKPSNGNQAFDLPFNI